jgi:hypothetical protein
MITFARALPAMPATFRNSVDHLESGYTASDMSFAAFTAERKRQEQIYNVAMSVNSYHSIVDYLSAMAIIASKK